MSDRRSVVAEHALLGLAFAAFGCAAREPSFSLDDEGGTGTDDSADGTTSPGTSGSTDGTPNDIPFELVSAAVDKTGKFIALRFSEPVAPVDGVDPSDFRISFALPTQLCGNGCIDQTTYWDPNFFADYYIEYQYQPNSMSRFETDLIIAGKQPTDVFLRFATPLDPGLCDYVNGYLDGYEALFVHYSPGGIPLESNDGESLAAIGPQWVEQDLPVWDSDGVFPFLDPKVSIPCSL